MHQDKNGGLIVMKKIVRFLNYTFLGKIETNSYETIPLEELGEAPQNPSKRPSSKDLATTKLILTTNWILATILVFFGLTMVIYAVFYRSEKVPDYINNVFYMVLGWFGNAYTSFLRIDQK